MSNDCIGTIREALGLAPEVDLVELANVILPSMPLHSGLVAGLFAQAPAINIAHKVVDVILATRNWARMVQSAWQGAEFKDVSVPGVPDSLVFCRAIRLDVLYISGQVMATPVATSDEPLPQVMQWQEDNGEQVVAWAIQGWILLDCTVGTLLLHGTAPNFSVYRLPAEPAQKVLPSLSARLSAPAPELPKVPIPELDVHLAQYPAAPWLAELVTQQIQSADPLTRLAAVGLLARLWTPVGSEAKKSILAKMLQGGASPAREYLNTYAAALTPEMLAWIERQAVQDADWLHDALESVSQDLLEFEDPSERQEHADNLREKRDDMESVLEVLEAAQAGTNLRTALKSLDRTALEKRVLLDEA
ncbi:MAG: hypothetical protein E4G90_05435, partial [Gemmatimonadales bacterium]